MESLVQTGDQLCRLGVFMTQSSPQPVCQLLLCFIFFLFLCLIVRCRLSQMKLCSFSYLILVIDWLLGCLLNRWIIHAELFMVTFKVIIYICHHQALMQFMNGRVGCVYMGGRKCLTRLLLLYCSHLVLHLLASINTWQHIYSFSQLHSIHASSCAHLFRHTTHTFSLLQLHSSPVLAPLLLSFVPASHKCAVTLRLVLLSCVYKDFVCLFISVLWIYCLNLKFDFLFLFFVNHAHLFSYHSLCFYRRYLTWGLI